MHRAAQCALVLDGHSRAAIETLQSLGKHDVEVDIAAESDCIAFHSKYARCRLTQPGAHCPRRLGEWIAAQDDERGYRLIVASTEFSLQAFRLLPDDSPLRRKAVLPENESLEIAVDKQKTHELACRLGIPVPHTALIESRSAAPPVERYPVVLKPLQSVVVAPEGAITMAPQIANNEIERTMILQNWRLHFPIQQQQYIAGRGVGIECLFNQGHGAWHFAHERVHEYPLTGGASTYRKSANADTRLLNSALLLLTALRWHGVAMVEFKVAPDGSFYLMEINPRLWGSLALSIDAGADFPFGLWRLANNESLPPQPHYTVPHYSRDLINDLQWIYENLRANHRDAMLMTRPRIRSFLEYLLPLTGKESWDHFSLRDPIVGLKILSETIRRYSKAVRRKLIEKHSDFLVLSSHQYAMRNLTRRRSPLRRLLFICYGNICRSPLAELLAKRALANVEIESAGFHQSEGRPCPDNIVTAARRIGIDLGDRRSRYLTEEQVKRADLILVMDATNYRELIRNYPEAGNRALLLGLFSKTPTVNIPDPYKASNKATCVVVSQISSAVNGLARQLQ